MKKSLLHYSILTALLVFLGAFSFSLAQDDEEVPERGGEGTVTIITNPPKAVVYLGGEELGITPIENKSFMSGRHDMTIMLAGEELITERVNVYKGRHTEIERELVMPYGTIIVKTNPGFTRIQIDGVDVGRTEGGPLTINNVEAGDHVISASAKGRRTRKMDVNIRGQDTVEVELNLKK